MTKRPNNSVLYEARRMISAYLAERRRELGITQEDLAARTGLGLATIQRMEAGKFWLNLKTLLVVGSVLDCFIFLEPKDSGAPLATMMRERWGKTSEN